MGHATQRGADRMAARRGDAFGAEIIAVAVVLGATAHEAHLRTVVDDRDAARREQPVVRVDEGVVAAGEARHVVVVVERGQLIGVLVRTAFDRERGAERRVVAARLLERRGDRLLHRKVEHAVVAVFVPGVGRDLGRFVVEGLAEHEEAGMAFADAGGEAIPESERLVADRVDAERRRALPDPLPVGADEVVHDGRIVRIEVAELGQVGFRVVPALQRVVRRIELGGRQVAVVGEQRASGIEDLAEAGLLLRHRPGRRAVVGDDVEHGLEALRAQATGQLGEAEAGARQVLVDRVEVHAPVAVVTGLAAIGQERGAGDLVAAGERFVGVVDDRRDPDRAEAHLADVIGIVEQAAEIAAEITEVGDHTIGAAQRYVEARVGTALIALVVARIAIDETVGDDEIHGLIGERLEGAVVLGHGRYTRGCTGAGRCRRAGGQHERGADSEHCRYATHVSLPARPLRPGARPWPARAACTGRR